MKKFVNVKIFVALLAAVMVLTACLTFTSCKDKEAGYVIDESGEITFTKPVVIRFAAPEGQFGDEITAFAAGFKAKYPQVTIKYEPIAGDWETKLLGMISGGTAPDIFWGTPYSYASRGALEPLDAYISKYGVDKSLYYESMFEYGNYNGKLYMMPRDYNKVVTYYNKNIFDEVFSGGAYSARTLPFTYDTEKYERTGKYYPANGWSWSEFVNTAKAIVKKTGGNFVRRGADISLDWISGGVAIIDALGCSIRTVDGNGVEGIDFDNAKNKEIIRSEIIDRINDGTFVNGIKNDVGNFYGGKTGMVFNSRPVASNMEEVFGSDWDVTTFPLIERDPVIPVGCSGYCLYAGSKVKDLAARFLCYIISEEGQEIFSGTGNCTPIIRSMSEDTNAVWRKYPREDINHDAFIWGAEYDRISYTYNFVNQDARGKFEKAWANIYVALLNGDKTLDEAFAYSQAELEKIFVR